MILPVKSRAGEPEPEPGARSPEPWSQRILEEPELEPEPLKVLLAPAPSNIFFYI